MTIMKMINKHRCILMYISWFSIRINNCAFIIEINTKYHLKNYIMCFF